MAQNDENSKRIADLKRAMAKKYYRRIKASKSAASKRKIIVKVKKYLRAAERLERKQTESEAK